MTQVRVDPSVDTPLAQLARRIVVTSPDAIIITTTARRVLDANEAAATMLGRTIAELKGVQVDDLVLPAERDAVATRERAALDGRAQYYTTRIVTSTGVERVVAVASSALHDGDRLLGTTATLRDITDQHAAHELLARSEARYRQLFEAGRGAVVTLDGQGRFASVNRSMEELTQFSREELVGTHFERLVWPNDLARSREELRRMLSGSDGHLESALLRKDGEVRRIGIAYSCTRPGAEVLCIIRDVTMEKELHDNVSNARRLADIGQLVSGVAHEFNNPLASISAFAQILLAQGDLGSDNRHSAEIIYSEARRAGRIVNNLLTFAWHEQASKVPVQLNTTLQETLEPRIPDLRSRGIDVIVGLDQQVRETMADNYQIQQVLQNLLNNAEHAIAAIERSHHSLAVRTRSLPDSIRIEIEDSGTGIQTDRLERIFDPFYTTKPTGSGTGLGLAISRRIVQQHNGSIWAENVPSGGARFCVELPYIVPPAVKTTATAPAQATAVPKTPSLRILLVDDEEAIRLALGRYLKAAGHEVVSTGRGTEALARTREEHFDAVILDIRMPDVSGLEVFEELTRSAPELARRVVFITGDMREELARSLKASGCGYLVKPFELSELLPLLPKERLPQR